MDALIQPMLPSSITHPPTHPPTHPLTPQPSQFLEEVLALPLELGKTRVARHRLHQETVGGGLPYWLVGWVGGWVRGREGKGVASYCPAPGNDQRRLALFL